MKIMLVDDDKMTRDSVASFLRALGHAVVEYEDGQQALAAVPSASPSLILSDIRMPQMTGIELVKQLTSLPLEKKPRVVLFTGYGTMESVLEALRAGAFDYILKPVNAEAIVALIDRINYAPGTKTGAETNPLSPGTSIPLGSCTLEATSPGMEHIVQQAYMYHRDRGVPVLIRGETGTGKEIVARLIHYGDGSDEPFVDINCAAITNNLFESELFGYEAGSFTGGQAKGQKGKVDLAQGGTLFLDEVAEIPLEIQGKLLRFIQEREFYRVGGLKKLKADIRIICATNRNLEQEIMGGRFRQDLYYRLRVGQIFIPPLCQRREDILPLAQLFLSKFSGQRNRRFTSISKETCAILLRHDWPGNVRELSNTIERATVMFDDHELLPEHLDLPSHEVLSSDSIPDKTRRYVSLADKIDENLLTQTLEAANGNRTVAAQKLGISRRSLYRLLEKSELI